MRISRYNVPALYQYAYQFKLVRNPNNLKPVMSQTNSTSQKQAQTPPISFFERYLTVWVALCIIAGTLLGLYWPGAAQELGAMEIAHVNIPVGFDLVHDHPHADENRFFRAQRGVRTACGYGNHVGRELADQTFQHGVIRLVFH